MWLIDTITLKLKEFPTEAGLEYAILSHRWGDDEVLFKDLNGSNDLNHLKNKQGFLKIKGCCQQARRDEYSWAWVDTCCIDKSSSAELSEAINSMFHWYRKSSVCYVYLSDVDDLDDLGGSVWFKRGWTLQELLAPAHVRFFSRDWTFLSDKQFLRDELRAITSIPKRALLNFQSKDYSVAEKMSWAAGRQTTREEDLAYCLMGIFDINMPLLYGERTKAFWRLQEMIMEFSTDLSIFLWNGQPCAQFALLAASPSCFSVKSPNMPTKNVREVFNLPKGWTRSNAGVSIELSLYPHHIGEDKKAVFMATMQKPVKYRISSFGIFLERLQGVGQKNNYKRVSVDNQTVIDLGPPTWTPVYNPNDLDFATNLLIAQEPMTPSSSAGSRSCVARWMALEPLEARAYQRAFDQSMGSSEQWPVISSELTTTSNICFNYLCIKAQGIVGYLLVSISDSLRLLVCFGFDVRSQPACVVAVCDQRFYVSELSSWNIMRAYYHLTCDAEENLKADSVADVYTLRAPDGRAEFYLFDHNMFLSLDIDAIGFDISPEFLEEQRGRQLPLEAEERKRQRQRDLFHI